VRDDEHLRMTLANADLEVYFRHWENKTMHQLIYDQYKRDGIFGRFQFEGDPGPFCMTLSHAYYNNGTYLPKVLPGKIYACKRGMHKLKDHRPGHEGELIDIETFEITGIEGCSGLLFHPFNFNDQSEGCTGLGQRIAKYDSDKDGDVDAEDDDMITASRKTFAAWMKRLEGVNVFMLQVS
jgi:hypothetical protein